MKLLLLPLLLIISLIPILHAQTPVSGYILSNTTWTTTGSPYLVTGNILVNNDVTLTIQPGVVVKFDTTKTLQIDGQLIAIGTAQNRIVFTASDSTPVRGSWGRIQFSNTSADAVFDAAGKYVSGSIMKHCDVRYGGGIAGEVTLYCDTASPYFSNCKIEECKKRGIYLVQSVSIIDSSSIRNCGSVAVEFVGPVAANLIVTNDTFENSVRGVLISGGTFNQFNVSNCMFINSGAALSGIKSVIGTTITNNIFRSNTSAIHGSLGTNAIISGNEFTGHTDGVMGEYQPGGNFSLFATNFTLTNNILEGNIGGIIANATYGRVEGNTFLNNRFTEIAAHGDMVLVEIAAPQGVIRNNFFDGNYFTNTSVGNYLVRANGVWEIANNIVKNNSPGQFALEGTPTICRNKFIDNSGYVIRSFNSRSGSFIHNNEFINNSGSGPIISCSNTSTIKNNEFQDNSCSSNPIVAISGSPSTIFNNRFLNNPNSNNPIISISNSSANIHNNDFLNSTGFSCLRLSGNGSPLVQQNNFVNPNVQYEVENLIPFGPGANINLTNNYWGTTDTVHIDSIIKDYFDDANLSVALYPPVLTAPAFVDTNASCTAVVCSTSVSGTVVHPSCYGSSNGLINITVANGIGNPYNYFWSNGGTTASVSNLASGIYTVTVIDRNSCSATKSFTLTQPFSPVSIVSAVVTDANCNTGGAISIAAGGGTPPYTYNWGSGITTEDRSGLNTGNYTVTVTDNKGCTVSQSFVIGQIAGPVISGVVTNSSCHNGCDGEIDLFASGIAPFTYNWGTRFESNEDTSGLCPGSYTVTVADSNNCGIAATFIITSPDTLIAFTTGTSNVSCFGYSDGSAMAVAIGGTAPYSFLWNDGQTTDTARALASGIYNVTVTDSLGCIALASDTMPDGYQVFVGVIVGLNAATINQHYSYSVNASPDYTYDWSVNNGIIVSGQGTNGIEVVWISAGTGLVQLIAHEQGCADTVSKPITVTDTTQNCSALFYLYPDTIPHSYFAINSASGIAQLSYSWNWGDGSAPDTMAYPTHTYNAPGFYTICLTITDSSGCTDTYCHPYYLFKTEGASEMIQVNVYPPSYTSISNDLTDSVTLYPNPTNNSITITASVREEATLLLVDAVGKEFLNQSSQPYELSAGVNIDMRQLNEGVYLLHVRTKKGSCVMKVLKY